MNMNSLISDPSPSSRGGPMNLWSSIHNLRLNISKAGEMRRDSSQKKQKRSFNTRYAEDETQDETAYLGLSKFMGEAGEAGEAGETGETCEDEGANSTIVHTSYQLHSPLRSRNLHHSHRNEDLPTDNEDVA